MFSYEYEPIREWLNPRKSWCLDNIINTKLSDFEYSEFTWSSFAYKYIEQNS